MENIDMTNPLVSIIVPAYNSAKHISATIKSVQNQTYKDFELIIVDDGSKDNTREVIESFLDDKRIRYIFQENKGQASARNNGIGKSKGLFIAFQDSDDLWKSDKLEKQIPVFDNPLVGVCYTDVEVMDGDTETIIEFHRSNSFEQMRRGNILQHLMFYNFIPFASVVVRKTCLDKVNGMDDSIVMGDDWDLLLRLSVFFNFDYVDEKLLIYRAGHSTQLSKNIDLRFKYQDIIIDNLFKSNPHLLPEVLKKKTFTFRLRDRACSYMISFPGRAFQNIFKAIKYEPFNVCNYKILSKIILYKYHILKTQV
jgi:glycosyltransferase involved in cell wall biosynthesis